MGITLLRTASVTGLAMVKMAVGVTVINRNGCCKPKFNCRFLVCLFFNQFSDRHCRSIRQLLCWITAFLLSLRYALNNDSTGSCNTLCLVTA